MDFHTHTNCSDGYLSPEKLVRRAHQNGCKVLAITDHDTVKAIAPAKKVAKQLGITLISGVEISTIWDGWPIHVVGLNVDEESPILLERLNANINAKKISVFTTDYIPMKDAVSLIHETGGFAVLAHPGRYALPGDQMIQLLKDFKKAKGDAIEVIFNNSTYGQFLYFSQLAQKYDFLVSIGSDFHSEKSAYDVGKLPKWEINGLKPIWEIMKINPDHRT